MIPDYYPEPSVEEINLSTGSFSEELPPHIPLLPGLGRVLVEAAGPMPDSIMRRAIREDGEWVLDRRFSMLLYLPDGSNGDAVVVVEKETDDGSLRDYYQCSLNRVAFYTEALMKDRNHATPDEQWFVSVVNSPDLAEMLEELGVGAASRKVCDTLASPPPEFECYGVPDKVTIPSDDGRDFEWLLNHD